MGREADQENEPRLAASAVTPVATFALSLGIRPELFEDTIGVPFLSLMSGDQVFDPRCVDSLWKVIDQERPNPTASVITASQLNPLESYNGISKGASFAPTLRDSIEFTCEFSSLISHDVEVRLEESENFASLSFFDPSDVYVSGHCNQAGIALHWQSLCDWVLGEITLHSVSFMHGCNGPRESYTNFFKCDVQFDQWSAHSRLVFDRTLLDLPLRTSDSLAFALARAQARQTLKETVPTPEDPLMNRIRAAIAESAAVGIFEVGPAIQQANVSMRTAQRYASRHGLNLHQLVQQERAKIACERLTTDPDLPLTDLAERLGYSDDRALRRAFKQWTGMSPSEFRRLVTRH